MSGSSTAKGSSPTISRAHQTAWPRPSGACWRVKLVAPAAGRSAIKAAYSALLAAPLQRVLELVGDVEMVLDDRLVAAGDEDEMLDARLARLVDDMLEHRPVDDGQHFLRHRLGGGQETRAEAGDRQNGFADWFVHVCSSCRSGGYDREARRVR